MNVKSRVIGGMQSMISLHLLTLYHSLERLQRYITIEQEEKPTESGVPPAYWPADGTLHVEGLSARYSADGPKVLQDISFDVKSGERVGIVGRTGSGKVIISVNVYPALHSLPAELPYPRPPSMHPD